MANGVVMERHERSPQGGPLSPLCARSVSDAARTQAARAEAQPASSIDQRNPRRNSAATKWRWPDSRPHGDGARIWQDAQSPE
jgi:hypothetical protein